MTDLPSTSLPLVLAVVASFAPTQARTVAVAAN